MNITCKFEQNILKINLLIAFLLKNCNAVRFSLRTLYMHIYDKLIMHHYVYMSEEHVLWLPFRIDITSN
jgi:hypothetical protein